MSTKLPILLEHIRIATPCRADWDDMSGDEQVRFCGKCEKNVYNISEMTRAEAEALVREKEGRLCVRMYQRADGTIITADCPVGVRRARLRARIWARVSGAAASAALALGLFSGRARADLAVGGDKNNTKVTQPKPPQPPVHVTGGAVAIQRPPEKLMGKIAMPVEPKKPDVKMGEPRMLLGDVAAPDTSKK
jgi:hypothetical protein